MQILTSSHLQFSRTLLLSVLLSLMFLARPVTTLARGVEDWKVGPIEVGELAWGKQDRQIQISNLSEDYKFLTVNCRAISTKDGFSRPRSFKSHYIIFPQMDTALSYTIDVPENIAPVQVEISVHDVVDTLDDLSWGVELIKNEARYNVSVPPGIEAAKSQIPRMTGATRYSKSLGTDLRLLTNLWFARGKTADEIGELAGMTAKEIRKYASDMRRDSLVEVVDGKILSTMNLIEALPYYLIDNLIKKHSKAFSEKIVELLPTYDAKLTELAEAGKITADRDEAFEGTAFLYHHYPIIGGVVLWEMLSGEFVSVDTLPPMLVDLNLPCTRNSKIYDYFLIDPQAPDGWHMFLLDEPRHRRVFGAHMPALDCAGARNDQLGKNFRFPKNTKPTYYSFSHSRTAKALSTLVDPMIPLRESFVSEIQNIYAKDQKELNPSHRFWLWNQLASQTLQALVLSGTVENLDQRFFIWNSSP